MRIIAFGLGLVLLTAAYAAGETAMTEIKQDFSGEAGGLPTGWQAINGAWRVEDGALAVDSLDGEAYINFGDASWQNYEVEASATFLEVRNDSRWLSVRFRAPADGGLPWSQFPVRQAASQGHGTEFAVKRGDGGWSIRCRESAPRDAELGKPMKLRVIVRGSHMQGYLDGDLLIESFLCFERDKGCVGLGVSGCRARFDDFVVRLLPDSPAHAAPTKPKPCDIVGHRGFSSIAPENTVVSAAKAIAVGADGAECDVRACKDGTIILMHDDKVDRTTDGEGPVDSFTAAELAALDAGSWKDAQYAGEPVPTLDALLQKHKGAKCQPVIEIKEEGIAQRVIDAVRAADMADDVAVIAFSDDVVREMRALDPSIPCAWLSAENLKGKSMAERVDWIATRARECNTNMVDLHFGMLSEEIIAGLHKEGIEVWCWTVNEPAVMAVLMRWGIDSITTDRPDTLAKVRKDLTGK
jgi:glycerophosphoryl diester phosphodiesterase